MSERSDIYLSSDAVKDLAHYSHLIPLNHGFSQDYVDRNYPGWKWNELLPVLISTDRYDRTARALRSNLVGVVFTVEGDVIDDDGSLVHPAKPVSLRIVSSEDTG